MGDQEFLNAKRGKKRRKSTKKCSYDVPDTLCNSVHIKDVEQSSGAILQTSKSSKLECTTFNIKGTREQILKALQLITISTGLKDIELEKAKRHWLEWVEQYFPDFEQRSYFIPPVQIMRVPIAEPNVAGQNVLMIKTDDTPNSSSMDLAMSSSKIPSVQKSDIIDDKAFYSVMSALKTFSEAHPEVFMCLSHYPFVSYLGEEGFYPAVAHLPLSSNLPKTYPLNWRQGDFDVLLIHRQYGFVVLEVKAVRINDETTEQVSKKLKEAAEQLKKAESMLSHLVSDISSGLRITKTIACPNLTTDQVQEIINNNELLGKDLCDCFKVQKIADAVHLILCSDHLLCHESQQTSRTDKLQSFQKWWHKLLDGPGSEKGLTSEVYRDLVARFCGPASSLTTKCVNEPRVSMKTLGNVVAHVGHCYADLKTLLPEQCELLKQAPRRIFMAGPPGTGRSTILLRIAIKWFLDENKDYVLSTWDYSRAATFRLRHLLLEDLKSRSTHSDRENRIVVLKKNFRKKEDVDITLNELADVVRHGPLYIIADEVGPDGKSEQNVFPEFCTRLLQCCKGIEDHLHFWAASCQTGLAPQELYGEKIQGWKLQKCTCPLRSPPPVVQEIKKFVEVPEDHTFPEYSQRNAPDHADGPPVERFYHCPREYAWTRVEDCVACAKKVARFLCTELTLGVSATCAGESTASIRHSPSLQYKDVFILSWVDLSEDAPILKELSQAGIPWKVMKNLDSDIEDVATDSSNVVWAAREQLVRGIKRKVVVVLDNHDDSNQEYKEARQRAMSRCSALLVLVCPPSEKSD